MGHSIDLPEDLTEAQLDGRACIHCAAEDQPMRPVEAWSELTSQLFECVDTLACADQGRVAVMKAARTTVTTAVSRSTLTSDASSRPSRPKAPSPCRGAFAGTDGAVQVAGQVSGSASAGPAPVHPSRGSRRQPHRRACGQHRDALDAAFARRSRTQPHRACPVLGRPASAARLALLVPLV
jgi:hypothetical protein